MIRLGCALLCLGILAGCAGPPSSGTSSRSGCGPSSSVNVSGEGMIGAGSDGFISGSEITFSTRVTPGGAGCTTLGAELRT